MEQVPSQERSSAEGNSGGKQRSVPFSLMQQAKQKPGTLKPKPETEAKE
jgi:hypothetical protein